MNDDRVADGRSLMQNGAVFIFGVDIGSTLDEEPQQIADSLFFAPVDGLPAGDHQWRRILQRDGVDVGFVLQEKTDHVDLIGMTTQIFAGSHQRSVTQRTSGIAFIGWIC